MSVPGLELFVTDIAPDTRFSVKKLEPAGEPSIIVVKQEALDPDNFYFLVARLYLTADQERWRECERLLRPYQQDDFAKHGLLPRWIDLKMRVLTHTESSVAAFAFAEEHLDLILQDQAMTAFRRGLVERILS